MSVVSSWEAEIRKDLTPFVDPGTSILVTSKGDVVEALWTQRRKERSARFTVNGSEGVSVKYEGSEYSYRSFLALDEMGDVLGIAQTTAKIFPEQIYVDTLAKLDGGGEAVEAISLIKHQIENRDLATGLTPFVMVTGEAGAGKTSLLKELVRRQALDYSQGKATYVFLYINAQGRALSRFHEALATELNELRVAVPYHAIAVLVRHGLIVPVVDGFDELLGAGGYDEAFASIWSFVQELDGRGAMVTSARSTYYEQEFLSRSERVNSEERGGWQLEGISLLGWNDANRDEFIERYSEIKKVDASQISSEIAKVFSGENHALSDKPLFVSRAIKVIADGGRLSGSGSLIRGLADEFISREIREKLITKDGTSILSDGQLRSLCSDFAEEMWNLGTRELDRLTVSEIAEIAMSGEKISAADEMTVMSRMPNMAFLQPGESAGSVAFEHELFFDHFLSERFAESVLNNAPGLKLMLSRAAMPESLVVGMAQIALNRPSFDLYSSLSNLNAAAASLVVNQEIVRENCGRIAAPLLVGSSSQGVSLKSFKLRDIIFPGSRIAFVSFEEVIFERVWFRRTDLRGAKFRACKSEGTIFESVMLDGATLLDIEGADANLDFSGVRYASEDGVRTIYEPTEVLRTLRFAKLPHAEELSEPVLREVAPAFASVVESYLKASSRMNPICASENPFEFHPDKDVWAQIMKIGADSGVFRVEFRQVKGPRNAFVRRLFRVEDIMKGIAVGTSTSPEIESFWTELERESKKK